MRQTRMTTSGVLKGCQISRRIFANFTISRPNIFNVYSRPEPCISGIRRMSSDTRPKVYITRNIPQKGVDLLSSKCELLQWKSDDPVPREELLKNVRGMDALFCLLTDKIDGDVLDAAGPNLKAVGTMSVGYDHIDMAACKARGIPVGFTPDVLTDATAELTVALLLATSRRLGEGIDAVKSGEWGTWKPMWLCGPGLSNSTVGIVGLGRIGKAVAARLKPFGVAKFLYTGRTESAKDDLGVQYVSLEDLLKNSDFVIACCALTPDTKEMFNASAFQMMKNTAIFVNTSRGGVVNQGDLYQALKTKQIFAAGLDVTTPEPLPTDSPLLSLKNCVIIPHIGSATDNARSAMAELTAKNILAVLHGEKMPCQIQM